jgi:predicted helicase
VKPHQRGGITPDREVIYRSRSAMQSLYGVESSIESNGKSNWFQFERDVHDAMAHAGYKVDHVASAKNGDAGVDVFAENKLGNEFWAIQCKCYSPKRKVGPAAIRELIGALSGYPSGTRGMMVTTSGFSSGAVDLAKQSGIELKLLGFSDEVSGHKILLKYEK